MHENRPPKLAYTVNEFCEASGLGRALLYRLWKEGKGPKRRRAGSKVLVDHEDGKAWLQTLPEETGTNSTA